MQDILLCTKNMNKQDEKIQWHPAFTASLQIELAENLDDLTFESEHQLTKKPLGIDVLIIKKKKETVIHKNIGRIFREHNIIEYKSPTDYLSINDFYKVHAYACLYQSDTESVNEINPSEITITIVSNSFPKKMLHHIKEKWKITMTKQESGIYILQNTPFPMQLIITKALSKDQNMWLNSLRNDLDTTKDVIPLLDIYKKHKDSTLYSAVIDLISKANPEQVKEAYRMSNGLLEVLHDEIQEDVKKLAEPMAKELAEPMAKQMAEQMAQQMAEKHIAKFVNRAKRDGKTKEHTALILEEDFELTQKQIQNYMEKYW